MANEVDVKDVGDVSSLSDTDKFQILVNNLLKNIPAKTLYSLLASKIPIVTSSQNGLVDKTLYMMMTSHNFSVPANSEIDTGLSLAGLIQVKAPNFSGDASIGVHCLHGQNIISLFNTSVIKFNSDGTYFIVYKKEVRGTIWIKNCMDSPSLIQIRFI